MQKEFWLQKWREGKTGFHLDKPMPLLLKYWPSLSLPAKSRVFVPLCGKSPDMAWLLDQGHRVLGVELSSLAVEQFFELHGLTPETHESPMGVHYVAGDLEIIQGDVLALDDATLTSCQAVYDRAAIVALPSDMRIRYVREVYGRLPAAARGLLITLEYPQQEMDGPPFSVGADNVHGLLGAEWQVEAMERRDILETEPGFRQKGLSSFHTRVYRLDKSGDD